MNYSIIDNEIVDLCKPSNTKQNNSLFDKAFYLNPFVLMNKIKFNDKNRIYSFNCNLSLFIVDYNSSQRIQEKSNFFGNLFKSITSNEKKTVPSPKEVEINIKAKGTYVLDRFRFKETLLGMGNIDIFLFLIENLAFDEEFNDISFWLVYNF